MKVSVSLLILLFLSLSHPVFADNRILIIGGGICDGGKTHLQVMLMSKEGVLMNGIAATLVGADGKPVSIYMYMRVPSTNETFYAVSPADDPEEIAPLTHDDYEARIKAEALNFYNMLHNLRNDCKMFRVLAPKND